MFDIFYSFMLNDCRNKKRKNEMLLSVHNITSIEMSEIKELKNNGSKVRDITIRDEKGKVIELTLFADEAENLKV